MKGEFAAVHSEIRRVDEKVGNFEKMLKLGDGMTMVESRVATLESRK
jgi:hypothetical protein